MTIPGNNWTYRPPKGAPTMTSDDKQTMTLTITGEQFAVLNDVFYEALQSDDADGEEMEAYIALRDDVKRQIEEQR